MSTKTKLKKKQEPKQMDDKSPKQERQVSKPTICPHCKGDFWAPAGKRMCPWCGKHFIVIDGVQGSMTGFFSKLLEGHVVSGEFSGAEVTWVNRGEKTPSDSRETEDENG